MQSRFHQLDSLLARCQHLWRFDPFQMSGQAELPWKESAPGLCHWLNTLSSEEIIRFKADTGLLLHSLPDVLPDVQQASLLSELPAEQLDGLELPRGLNSGIPGRKLDQILSISEFALHHHPSGEWLEWCAGKGYLGRILASQSGEKVTSLEWQENLCCAGQQEADQRGLPMTFIHGDAFSPQAKGLLKASSHAVALHACGDLHVQLLKNVTESGSEAVTISPCCYHLIRDETYQPLSVAAKRSALVLNRKELRIPLQETVTGGERVVRHRYTEMSFRLGLDLLLKALTDQKEYMAVPSIKKSALSEGFEAFCRWAANERGFILPDADFSFWQAEGEKRFWQMERLSLVQQLFRRPLEIWLALDRGLYLQENGYQVSLSTFCERASTPRNILIHAQRI